MTKHESYKNPTIQEALCEFRLTPSQDFTWDRKSSTAILNSLGTKNFPGIEPIHEMGIEVQMDETGHSSQKLIQGLQKIRYSNEDGSLLVQVSPNSFSFHAVNKYPGWNSVLKEILSTWTKVKSVTKPTGINRIGLRYINKIPLQKNKKISDWLKPSQYIPEDFIQSEIQSKFRAESHVDESITILNIAANDKKAPDYSLFFDIDRLQNIKGIPKEQELSRIIDTLHDHVWDIFNNSRTDLYLKYLQGKV